MNKNVSDNKNKTTEEWTIGKDRKLGIEILPADDRLSVRLTLPGKKPCVLHWGVCQKISGPWELPPQSIWPRGSHAAGETAVQSPFAAENGSSTISIDFEGKRQFTLMVFVLYFPEDEYWDNNHGRNYYLMLPQPGEAVISPARALEDAGQDKEVVFQQTFGLEAGRQLAAAVYKEDDRYQVNLFTDMPGPLLMHWGETRRSRHEWLPPAKSHRPENTVLVDNKAARTPFVAEEGLNRLAFEWPQEDMPLGITFVLYQPDIGQWLKKNGTNFYIPLATPVYEGEAFKSADLAGVADEIIQAETGRNSWTLMHRFNLCYDLLERVGNDIEGLALFYVWLRFSSIRQLDWQRNYNTKPRELTHAQQRLTLKFAELYRQSPPASREMIRLIFSTLGRGAEGGRGQRIRDDILHIMHRHHVKEVTGHFLEEWHQKLHNNATPDDIVICEAYLAFLRSNGNLGLFYQTLKEGGVTKERLINFERPIVTDPDFNPHIKDGLIHDFENYLSLLKSVHSATDLHSAVEAAGHCLHGEMNDRAWHIYNSRDDNAIGVVDRLRTITEERRNLKAQLDNGPDEQCIRDILYLDIAFEEFLRVAVERDLHKSLSERQLAELTGLLIDNVRHSHGNSELIFSLSQWQRLQQQPAKGREWYLHARSVLDRVSRILGSYIDTFYNLLQPKAEHLGTAFSAESWTIDIFTQEVVRAGSPFVLSILLRQIDPLLRKGAELGDWQVISHAGASGTVKEETLSKIQDKTYKNPTVIVTDKISGDEVIPKGVSAVLTADAVDILSHVSIRARNAGVLFAACFNEDIIRSLKELAGKAVALSVDARGDVSIEKGIKQVQSQAATEKAGKKLDIRQPAKSKAYAIAFTEFSDKVVGGKSNQLLTLKGKLPKWVQLPRSVALPFGVCEQVLADKRNKTIKKRYDQLVSQVDGKPHEILPELRHALMELEAPATLFTSLKKVMTAEGLTLPKNLDIAWQRIKHVWASKWTERAFRSRRQMGISHDALYMAVLIQEVINAEYAFVIHTANPFSGDKNELYAEVAPGLGETICSGNYPGRALSFTCRKGKKLEPHLVSFPSKNVALRGAGIIFRSDSNGEDLEEYAGAGLYESVLLEPPQTEVVDYTKNTLLWDNKFREGLLKKITETGIEVEKALDGCAQDIEGAYADGKYYVLQTRQQVGLESKTRT